MSLYIRRVIIVGSTNHLHSLIGNTKTLQGKPFDERYVKTPRAKQNLKPFITHEDVDTKSQKDGLTVSGSFPVVHNMAEIRLGGRYNSSFTKFPKMQAILASIEGRRWYGKSKQGMTESETGKQTKFNQERESRYQKLKELIKEKHIKPKEGDEDSAPLRRPEV